MTSSSTYNWSDNIMKMETKAVKYNSPTVSAVIYKIKLYIKEYWKSTSNTEMLDTSKYTS